MEYKPLFAGIAAGSVLLAATLFVGEPVTGKGRVVAYSPEATATVQANQTATAQAQAATAAVPPPPTPPPTTPISSTGSVNEPKQIPFSEETLAHLKVPEGFRVDVFAQGLGNTRMMAVAEDGTVYVTRRAQGDVLALNDRDGDGQADEVRTIASKLPYVHGILLHDGFMFLATDTKVYRAAIESNGTLGKLETIIDDLPDAGQHPNRTLAFGPDGMLYITVGSDCNVCTEPNEEQATILRAMPDGSSREIFARGLRNTIGFDWHPQTGTLWGMDHGSDWRGDDQPPEELNFLVPGGNYGWPFCYGKQQVDIYNQNDPPGTTKEAYCETTLPATLTYTAHAAPINFLFYKGRAFPAQYTGDAFVTFRGSWNRTTPSGYNVARVRYDNGWPVGFEDFLTGFLSDNGAGTYGRLAGLAVTPSGALLVTDDQNGVIYRVSWVGGQ